MCVIYFIGFSNQCRYFYVMPTFAKVRGSSTTIREKQQVEKKTIKTELTDYYNSIQSLRIKHNELSSNLLQLVSKFISRALLGNINNSL